MKEMMKEVVVIEPHKVEVREVPVPEPVVRMAARQQRATARRKAVMKNGALA